MAKHHSILKGKASRVSRLPETYSSKWQKQKSWVLSYRFIHLKLCSCFPVICLVPSLSSTGCCYSCLGSRQNDVDISLTSGWLNCFSRVSTLVEYSHIQCSREWKRFFPWGGINFCGILVLYSTLWIFSEKSLYKLKTKLWKFMLLEMQ